MLPFLNTDPALFALTSPVPGAVTAPDMTAQAGFATVLAAGDGAEGTQGAAEIAWPVPVSANPVQPAETEKTPDDSARDPRAEPEVVGTGGADTVLPRVAAPLTAPVTESVPLPRLAATPDDGAEAPADVLPGLPVEPPRKAEPQPLAQEVRTTVAPDAIPVAPAQVARAEISEKPSVPAPSDTVRVPQPAVVPVTQAAATPAQGAARISDAPQPTKAVPQPDGGSVPSGLASTPLPVTPRLAEPSDAAQQAARDIVNAEPAASRGKPADQARALAASQPDLPQTATQPAAPQNAEPKRAEPAQAGPVEAKAPPEGLRPGSLPGPQSFPQTAPAPMPEQAQGLNQAQLAEPKAMAQEHNVPQNLPNAPAEVPEQAASGPVHPVEGRAPAQAAAIAPQPISVTPLRAETTVTPEQPLPAAQPMPAPEPVGAPQPTPADPTPNSAPELTVESARLAASAEEGVSPEADDLPPLSPLRTAETAPVRADAALTRPETARAVVQQLAVAVEARADGPVEVSLNPEELGRVRMVLHSHEAGMTVGVVAERGETLDLLRRHADMLARELQQMGYEAVQFDFGQSPSERDDPAAGADLSPGAEDLGPGDDTQHAGATGPGMVRTTELDLRL